MLTLPSHVPNTDTGNAANIWLSFTFFQPNQELPFTLLDASELQWIKGKSAKRAATFAWSRALLRQLCAEKLKVEPYQVQISLPAANKISLRVAGEIVYCSISHSQQLVAVAISTDADIGLDVELISSHRDKRRYADLYPALRHDCDSDQQFYQRWTAIEASIKLHGGELFAMLAQQQPALALQLKHWQQQNYQFCVASHFAIKSCIVQQVNSQSVTLIE
ncbi:hypothetical protein A5320_16840 [Rheinheimera sp. SA_1]|nr:hypothetical protein A5320_16840 [Rheinheimera sp. SA_1]